MNNQIKSEQFKTQKIIRMDLIKGGTDSDKDKDKKKEEEKEIDMVNMSFGWGSVTNSTIM